MGAARFIEYGPRDTAPPPFTSGRGRFLGLVLQGDPAKIQALCDDFNSVAQSVWENAPQDVRPPGPTVYRSLTSSVMFFVGEWPGLRASTFPMRGEANENQASLWLPLEAGRERDGVFEPERFCVMVPYMFVDNPMSLLNGREDFGYPKTAARFPKCDWQNWEATIEAYGGNYKPGNAANWVSVLTLKPPGPKPDAARAAVTPDELTAEIIKRMSEEGGKDAQVNDAAAPNAAGAPIGGATALDFVAKFVAGEVPQVFLKQFRDEKEGPGVCYQRIIEAPVKFAAPKILPVFEKWQLTVEDYDSHPMRTDLGLESNPTSKITFEFEASLELEAGEQIV